MWPKGLSLSLSLSSSSSSTTVFTQLSERENTGSFVRPIRKTTPPSLSARSALSFCVMCTCSVHKTHTHTQTLTEMLWKGAGWEGETNRDSTRKRVLHSTVFSSLLLHFRLKRNKEAKCERKTSPIVHSFFLYAGTYYKPESRWKAAFQEYCLKFVISHH